MVHDQGQGWDDDGWGDDDDNGASWFDNVQQPVEPQQNVQQVEHVQPEVVQAQPENVNHLQQVLDAKEAECQALKSERDDLINVQSTLQAHIESLKVSFLQKSNLSLEDFDHILILREGLKMKILVLDKIARQKFEFRQI